MIRSLLCTAIALLFAGPALAVTEALSIPACADADLTISADSHWDNVNDVGTGFITGVTSADYTAKGTISLTRDGTSANPRWIIFCGTDPTSHAYARSSANKAKVQQITCQADFIRIVGLTFTRGSTGRLMQIDESCDDLIVHENEFTGGSNGGGQLKLAGGDDTLIQLNVFHTTIETADQDNHCIKFDSDGGDQVVGTKILSNEIFDCAGDGVQIGDSTDTTGGYETILIEDNDIYFTTAIYSDGSGNKDPGGNSMCAEDAIDTKQGSATTNIVNLSLAGSPDLGTLAKWRLCLLFQNILSSSK